LFLLAGLVYVGFYAYGVVMGVFSPTAMILLSCVVALFVLGNLRHVIRIRRAIRPR
jgi:hypothetical protein